VCGDDLVVCDRVYSLVVVVYSLVVVVYSLGVMRINLAVVCVFDERLSVVRDERSYKNFSFVKSEKRRKFIFS
jgi:hypothetical protein